MRKSISNTVWFGALFVGAVAVVHCGGGDDSGANTGGSPGTGGSATGTGGRATGTGGRATGTGGAAGTGGAIVRDASAGTGGAAGAGGGGTAGAGGAGAGGTGAAGGTADAGRTPDASVGGNPNNPFCPLTEPLVGSECTPPGADAGPGANACLYTVETDAGAITQSCACNNRVAQRDDAGALVRNDAGAVVVIVEWACNRVANPVDAGLRDVCPAANVNNNMNCNAFVTGLVCPGNGGRTCTCEPAAAGNVNKQWNCVLPPADAAAGD